MTDILTVFSTLGGILGGIFLLSWGMRLCAARGWIPRTMMPPVLPCLSIVGSMGLDQKRRLWVVRFYDRDILLAVGADRVDVIAAHSPVDGGRNGGVFFKEGAEGPEINPMDRPHERVQTNKA